MAVSQKALKFSPYAWAKLLFLRDVGDTEIGGFGVCPNDPLTVEDFVLVKQKCSSAFVDLDEDSVAAYCEKMAIEKKMRSSQYMRIWIHTHPAIGAEPSGHDENVFESTFGAFDWAVMFILAKRGERTAKIRVNKDPMIETELAVMIDHTLDFPATDKAAWKEEYDACVTKNTYTTTSFHNWRDDDPWDSPGNNWWNRNREAAKTREEAEKKEEKAKEESLKARTNNRPHKGHLAGGEKELARRKRRFSGTWKDLANEDKKLVAAACKSNPKILEKIQNDVAWGLITSWPDAFEWYVKDLSSAAGGVSEAAAKHTAEVERDLAAVREQRRKIFDGSWTDMDYATQVNFSAALNYENYEFLDECIERDFEAGLVDTYQEAYDLYSAEVLSAITVIEAAGLRAEDVAVMITPDEQREADKDHDAVLAATEAQEQSLAIAEDVFSHTIKEMDPHERLYHQNHGNFAGGPV